MKILFEHPCILPVKDYGGTERIIYWLMKELAKRGHDVFFIGLEGSEVDKIGVKLIPHNKGDWRSLVPKDIELVHLFYNPPKDWEFDFPIMVTIEGNGQPDEVFHRNSVFVSRKHAENHNSQQFVYNCIDLDEYPYKKRSQMNWDSFMFLAKGSWSVKNLKDCISVCKKNKKHLHIAGGRSLMPSRLIHSYGMVAQKDKQAIFDQVDALLFPVRWHEPFGIAIIEVMSQGLPVVGTPYGSLPELIVDGTGFICHDYQELLQTTGMENPKFDQDFIRHYVEKTFSTPVIADRYLSYYERVLKGESLNNEAPRTVGTVHPETLLPF